MRRRRYWTCTTNSLANPRCRAHVAGDYVHELGTDIEPVKLVEFPHARRTRDVDLRQIIADHVETDEQQAAAAQRRRHLRADPAVALAQRYPDAGAAGGEIAAGFAGLGNAGEGVGDRLAVDQQDALVAVGD